MEKILIRKWRLALLLGMALLMHCQKERSPFPGYVDQLESSSILESMQNIHLNFTPGQQRVEFGNCEGGKSRDKRAFPLAADNVWSLSGGENVSADSLQAFQEKLKALENIFKGFEFSTEVLSAKAMDNCGETFLLSFKSGEILVHSNANIDNVIGFQYQRTVLKDNWSLYQLK